MKTFLKHNSHLTFEEIQKYLLNDLDAKALYDVENHLLDCPLCSCAVEGFQNSTDLGEDRKALKKLNKEIKLKTRREKVTVMWSMKIAASLLFLLGSVFTVFYLQPDSMVDNYTSMITDEFSLDKRFGANETEFGQAIKYCENSEFIKCVSALEKCVEKEPENSGLQYFLGLAHFKNYNYNEAISNFRKVRNSTSSYYDDAFWYSILAHLKNEEKSKAISLLEEYTIKNPQGFYIEDAKKLKSDLE